MSEYRDTGEFLEVEAEKLDRWDLVAWRMYGNAALQTVLIKANRHLFEDGVTVPAILSGQTIRVPILERLDQDQVGSSAERLPPWRRQPV